MPPQKRKRPVAHQAMPDTVDDKILKLIEAQQKTDDQLRQLIGFNQRQNALLEGSLTEFIASRILQDSRLADVTVDVYHSMRLQDKRGQVVVEIDGLIHCSIGECRRAIVIEAKSNISADIQEIVSKPEKFGKYICLLNKYKASKIPTRMRRNFILHGMCMDEVIFVAGSRWMHKQDARRLVSAHIYPISLDSEACDTLVTDSVSQLCGHVYKALMTNEPCTVTVRTEFLRQGA